MSARSYLLDVAGGRRKIRVLETGEGRPLVFLHSAGGLTEDNPKSGSRRRTAWHWEDIISTFACKSGRL